jgi:hypothetical protein
VRPLDDTNAENATGWVPPQPSPTLVPPRKRDRLLWLWPVVAVFIMALSGAVFGAFGTLLTAVVVLSALILFVGEDNEVMGIRLRLGITVLALVLAAGLIVGNRAGIGFLSSTAQDFSAAANSGSSGQHPLDLRGRRVSAKDIDGRDLRGAQLTGAVLDGLDLHGRDLRGATATGASLHGVNLEHARLNAADLRGADLHGACLYRADLSGALLDGADATGADVTSVSVSQSQTSKAMSWPGSQGATATSQLPTCP